MKKNLIIAKFKDATDKDIYWDACFFTKLSERELQKKVKEVVEKFENEEFYDYSFIDIVEDLRKQNLVDEVNFDVDWYEIFV